MILLGRAKERGTFLISYKPPHTLLIGRPGSVQTYCLGARTLIRGGLSFVLSSIIQLTKDKIELLNPDGSYYLEPTKYQTCFERNGLFILPHCCAPLYATHPWPFGWTLYSIIDLPIDFYRLLIDNREFGNRWDLLSSIRAYLIKLE